MEDYELMVKKIHGEIRLATHILFDNQIQTKKDGLHIEMKFLQELNKQKQTIEDQIAGIILRYKEHVFKLTLHPIPYTNHYPRWCTNLLPYVKILTLKNHEYDLGRRRFPRWIQDGDYSNLKKLNIIYRRKFNKAEYKTSIFEKLPCIINSTNKLETLRFKGPDINKTGKNPDLENLVELYIEFCPLKRISDKIEELDDHEVLRINTKYKDKITKLPKQIGQMEDLRLLDVVNVRIHRLIDEGEINVQGDKCNVIAGVDGIFFRNDPGRNYQIHFEGIIQQATSVVNIGLNFVFKVLGIP